MTNGAQPLMLAAVEPAPLRTRVLRGVNALRIAFTPPDPAWAAASYSLMAVWAAVFVAFFLMDVLPNFSLAKAVGLTVFYGALALASIVAALVVRTLSRLWRGYRWALMTSLPPLLFVGFIGWGPHGLVIVTILVLAVSLIAGAVTSLARSRRPGGQGLVAGVALGVGVCLATGLIYGLLHRPADPNPTFTGYHLTGARLDLPNPAARGPYAVRTFTYGSGSDRRRPEYAQGARFLTRPVDISRFDAWSGLQGALRTAYWGFGPTAAPLQARVWAPKGAGPFPLVLIVHGNHAMETASEEGYAYLGELLASQGFLVASVDENFLNLSVADYVSPTKGRDGAENAARAFILLEHLRLWRAWTADPAHPLHGLADMDHIALIGHSRGGEAVATAAAFNRLRAWPDDATVPFDYGFQIRAVAAIAPVDGQYEISRRPTVLDDLDYFVVHGSMDGDMNSFAGASQYARTALTPGSSHFKATLYVKDANHSQFNTRWGRNDYSGALGFLLDDRAVIDAGAQRQTAKAYLSAFLQASLKGEDGYRAMLKDPRRGAAWLPDLYLSANYAEAGGVTLADYDEDLDVDSGSRPDVTILAQGLSAWREIFPRNKFRDLDTRQALIAWDHKVHAAPAYGLRFAPLAAPVDGDLVFGLSQSGEGSQADKLDWTVVLKDAAGLEARVPLSADQALYPQIKGQTRRLAFAESAPPSEIVMRGYRLPIAAFASANPRLDLTRIAAVRFDFDRSPQGSIVLDDVGFSGGPAAPESPVRIRRSR